MSEGRIKLARWSITRQRIPPKLSDFANAATCRHTRNMRRVCGYKECYHVPLYALIFAVLLCTFLLNFALPIACNTSLTAFMMPTKRSRRTKNWSMYPSLHRDVADLLEGDDIIFEYHHRDDEDNCISEYDTSIMGEFICRNSRCKLEAWPSKQIAITIREYSGQRYNARVYHQSCRRCRKPSKPDLDNSYAERVAYRIKKWCGVEMEAPPFNGHSDGPHRSDLCEGCKQGHCSRMVARF